MDARILKFPQRGGGVTPKDAWLSVKDDYSRYLITQGRTPDTIRTYISNVDFYARWLKERNLPLMSASRMHVESYVAAELQRVSRSTAMNRLLACRSFYRYLVAVRKRTSDPTMHIPIKREKLAPPRPFSPSELRALVFEAKYCRFPEMLPIILLLIGSGCRRAEIMKLTTDDIDWERGRVLIHGKGSKQRWVAPGATALQALAEYLSATRKEGQIWPFSGHMMYKLLREIAKKGSVVNAYPHRFRGTFAYTFLKHYGNLPALKEILGHENLQTTEVYATWGIAEGALAMQSQLDLAHEFTLETSTEAADASPAGG